MKLFIAGREIAVHPAPYSTLEAAAQQLRAEVPQRNETDLLRFQAECSAQTVKDQAREINRLRDLLESFEVRVADPVARPFGKFLTLAALLEDAESDSPRWVTPRHVKAQPGELRAEAMGDGDDDGRGL